VADQRNRLAPATSRSSPVVRQGCIMQVEALPVQQPLDAETLLNVGQCARLTLLRRCRDRPPTERVGAIDEGKGGKNRARLAERE